MSIFSSIWEGLKSFFRAVANVIKKIWRAIVNFVKDVVNYFKKLFLDPQKDTPFIIDAGELGQRIKEAPKVDVGIFEGVYHEDTNTITDYRELSAGELDQQTKDVLDKGQDGIVVLN